MVDGFLRNEILSIKEISSQSYRMRVILRIAELLQDCLFTQFSSHVSQRNMLEKVTEEDYFNALENKVLIKVPEESNI